MSVHRPRLAQRFAAATLAASVFAGCQDQDPRGGNPGAVGSPADVELECEALGYPCTWADVDPAIADRTFELASAGVELLVATGGMEAVGSMLAEQPGIAEVLGDDRALRFWLEGGRPVWVMDSPEGTLGFGSSGGSAGAGSDATVLPQASPNDVAGTQRSDVGTDRPKKKSLVLSPYEWEFGEHRKVVEALRNVPEYGCTDGCEIKEVQNDFPSFDGMLPTANVAFADGRVKENVQISNFGEWHEYDLVHVTTHGTTVCRKPAMIWVQGGAISHKVVGAEETCVTVLATGITYSLAEIQMSNARGWELGTGGRMMNLLVLPDSTNGIEVAFAPRNKRCFDPESSYNEELGPPITEANHPQLYAQFKCDHRIVASVVLTDDYFKAVYPNGLDNNIVFLNACQSMKEQDQTLATWLVRGSPTIGKAPTSVVVGWTINGKVNHTTRVAGVFYQLALGHSTDYSFEPIDPSGNTPSTVTLKAPDEREEVKRRRLSVSEAVDSTVKLLPVETEGLSLLTPAGPIAVATGAGTSPSGGGATQSLTPASWGLQGRPQMRAREIVKLLDPITEEEVEDGGLLMTSTAFADGLQDSLELVFVVNSVLPGQRPQDYRLNLHIDGNQMDLDEGLHPDDVHDGVGARRVIVPLGRALSGPTRSDLEVWVELPEGGGISRWVYEDVEIVGPEITYSGYRTGRFEGALETSLTALPNITTTVDQRVRCMITFGATDVHGRSVTIGGALTAPLRVGVYPISGPVEVQATSTEGHRYTKLEGQLNTFGLEGWGPPGPDAFRAQGTGGTLTVESIAESGIRVSFHATAGGPITYRGRLVAPLDGLSSFADLGPSCLTVGP